MCVCVCVCVWSVLNEHDVLTIQSHYRTGICVHYIGHTDLLVSSCHAQPRFTRSSSVSVFKNDVHSKVNTRELTTL